MTKGATIRQYALDAVGSPYIYGATAQSCTTAYRKARMEQYPEYASTMQKNCPALNGRQSSCAGCKYQGKKAYDCAQLTRKAAVAAGLTLPSGATSQWNKGDWAQKGTIEQMPKNKVCMLYRQKSGTTIMQHTGISLGDGTFVDARGHSYGVLHSKLGSYAWTHYAILKGVDDDMNTITTNDATATIPSANTESLPTLRKGSKGDTVKRLQGMLLLLHYALPKFGADGSFGNETDLAIRAFQTDNKLTVDGICGKNTWSALEKAVAQDEAENEDIDETLYAVTIPHLTETEKDKLLLTHVNAQAVVE